MTTENILKIKQYDKTVAVRASAITTIKLCEDTYTPTPGKFYVRISTKDEFFILRKDNDNTTDDKLLNYWIKKWEWALENNSKGVFIREE